MEKNCPTCYEEKCNNCSVYKGTIYLNKIFEGLTLSDQAKMIEKIESDKSNLLSLINSSQKFKIYEKREMENLIDSNVILMKRLELNRLNPAC